MQGKLIVVCAFLSVASCSVALASEHGRFRKLFSKLKNVLRSKYPQVKNSQVKRPQVEPAQPEMKRNAIVLACIFTDMPAAVRELLQLQLPIPLCDIILSYWPSDWKEKVLFHNRPPGIGMVLSFAYTLHNNRLLAISGSDYSDYSITLWDPCNEQVHVVLRAYARHISDLAFFPSHCMFVSISYEKTIKFWKIGDELQEACCVKTIDARDSIFGLAISRDYESFAYTSGGSVYVHKVATGELCFIHDYSQGFARDIAWNYNGKFLLLGSGNSIYVLNVHEKHILAQLPFNCDYISALACSPIKNEVVVAPGDEEIHLLDITSLKTIRTMKSLGRKNCIAWAPNGEYVASAGFFPQSGMGEGIVSIWNTQTGSLIAELGKNSHNVALHFLMSNGLLIVDVNGRVTLFSNLD